MKKPVIGIVLDNEEKGSYSEYPYYILRKHYFNAVARAGGLPLGIDHTVESVSDYIDIVDGLLMPGGDYDIPPSFYGDKNIHKSVVTKEGRLDFDLAITKLFVNADRPVLGICAGEQLLAVLHGSTLVQDIDSEIQNPERHYNNDREAIAHEIILTEGGLLHSIVGKTNFGVNSHHHQSVKRTGESVRVSAVSGDGVIEAIEILNKKFCLGVQWHPEYLNTEEDVEIFKAFISACRK